MWKGERSVGPIKFKIHLRRIRDRGKEFGERKRGWYLGRE